MNKQILNKTLEEMPENFTSFFFSAVGQKYGLTKRFAANGNIVDYLNKHAVKVGGKYSKSWRKRQPKINNNEINYEVIEPKITLDEAIAMIKKAGGKVLMPKTQYEEV